MSKKHHNSQYLYTSVPADVSTSYTAPAAPPDDIPPPSYDEALRSSPSVSTAPIIDNSLDGYILDQSTTPCIPAESGSTGQQPHSHTTIPMATPCKQTDGYQGRPLPPTYSIYKAEYTTTKEGVISRDVHINQDAEALMQFLYQHNTPPKMSISFYGYHDETTWTTRISRDADGNECRTQEPTTHRVCDFNFSVDCSDDVSPICQGIYVLPDPKTGEVHTIRQLCDNYIKEKNKLKELHLEKVINWDFNELTEAFTSAIRNSGYYDTIEVNFFFENHKVTVKTAAPISRFADNKIARFFLFITCLWIIAYPLLVLFRKRFGHSTLKSGWNMKMSERACYDKYIQEVIGGCHSNRYPRTGQFNFIRPNITI